MRRTKILATVGPASATPESLRGLFTAGADGLRVNFSHGETSEHRQAIRNARAAGRAVGREVFVVADLQGPKIRLGEIVPSPLTLETGAPWTLDEDPRAGDVSRAPLLVPGFARSAAPGDRILLGDGAVELEVERVADGAVHTRVRAGGTVRSHMGAFLPKTRLRPKILGPKDRADLRVAIEEGVDYVALSFVSGPEDLRSAQRTAERFGATEAIGWISKIERGEALDRIEAILARSDAIMVARGDLGIEVPLERLALEQKRLVACARRAGKPAIVATQMLLSMVDAPRPTRAEATDVANAVMDGADALMLSEETAIGRYPAPAVGWLDRIARTAESSGRIAALDRPEPADPVDRAEQAVADAAVRLAEGLPASAIVTPTHSGRTARWIASRRPRAPVLALSSQLPTRRRLGLVWGVYAVPLAREVDLLHLRDEARSAARRWSDVEPKGPLVLTAGYPVQGNPTNLVTVVEPARARRGPSVGNRGRGRSGTGRGSARGHGQ